MFEKKKTKIIEKAAKVVEDWNKTPEANKVLYVKAIDNITDKKLNFVWYSAIAWIIPMILIFVVDSLLMRIVFLGSVLVWGASVLLMCVYVVFLDKITKKKARKDIAEYKY